MHSTFFAVVSLASLVSAAPGAVCSKAPYNALLPLSKNNYLQAFCTSRYPIPASTKTISTQWNTITSTVSSTTTFSVTATPTVLVSSTESDLTTTTVPVTSIETETATTTTTQTLTSIVSTLTQTTTIITGSGTFYKRDAEPTLFAAIEERAAALASPTGHGYARNTKAQSAYTACAGFTKSAVASKISTLCSCIETPKTLSVVATSTTSTTTTSIVSTTITQTSPTTTTLVSTTILISTASSTVPTTTTTTTTTTVSSTVPATATSVVQYNACGQNFAAPDGTPIGIRCGQTNGSGGSVRSTTTPGSFYACLYAAAFDSSSTAFTFQLSNGQCVIYQQFSTNSAMVAAADFAYGYFNPA
ncbi:hypothetical protein LTR95_011995 [Oleoguttula sp. CCFEE 5521]